MSVLLKKIDVPAEVRKGPAGMCAERIEIYDDHVKAFGGTNGVWFFKDYNGVAWQAASLACAFASIVFTTPVNQSNYLQNGVNILQDKSRIFFSSGAFSYKEANNFVLPLKKELEEVLTKYKESTHNEATATGTISVADEVKKFKDLADAGIITQEEFEAKKKQLLGL